MPRPKKPGAPEPKKRSRNGCWPCKGRKVKCGEERPHCINCQRIGETCDYSIRLNWDGRRGKRVSDSGFDNGSPLSPNRTRREFTIINQVINSPTTPVQVTRSPTSQISTAGIMDFNSFKSPMENTMFKSLGNDCLQSPLSATFGDSGASRQFPSNIHRVPTSPDSPKTFGQFGESSSSSTTSLVKDVKPRPSRSSTNDGTMFSSFQATIHYTPPTGQQLLPIVPNHDVEMSYSGYTQSRHASFSHSHSPNFHHLEEPSPITPAQSSSSDEDAHMTNSAHMVPSPPTMKHASNHSSHHSSHHQTPTTIHSTPTARVDVNSLLSETPIAYPEKNFPIHISWNEVHLWDERRVQEQSKPEDLFFFGYDLGRKDRDLENDDLHSIVPELPSGEIKAESPPNAQDMRVSSAWCTMPTTTADGGEYYREPVKILIPRKFMPLPPTLAVNPMHLLYFHHFLNHTAKVLMPYDDAERNPYRAVLPEIAMAEPHLLSLLLAYSASHRARVLGHKEPEVRMAKWVMEVLPQLSASFPADHSKASIACLASTIMLASLEIISPNAFGSQIGWQSHLKFARGMMMNRRLWRPDTKTKQGECCAFLWSWFAYLDVLGSLSGGKWSKEVSPRWAEYYTSISDDPQVLDEIDCIMGFSIRCTGLLAQVSDFCQRSLPYRFDENNNLNPDWVPEPRMLEEGENLDRLLVQSLHVNNRFCEHIRPGSVDRRSLMEIFATNEAFHWAGLVHLRRRGLNKPQTDPAVTSAIGEIMRCMDIIRPGGTGETGFLFPMFTAGCETLEPRFWAEIDRRFNNVEAHGMKQVSQARKLLRRVWELGVPWETLMKDEFIG